jgi:hypothetical protein
MKNKNKKSVCPNGKDPACIKCAVEQYKEFCAWLTKLSSKHSGDWRRQVVDVKDMDESKIKRMRKAVLAYMATDSLQVSSMSGITASTSRSAAGKAGPAIFMLTVPITSVFQVAPACCILPNQIQAAFPHITLQLGTVLGCKKCPTICCIINTTAALLPGNLHFFAAVAVGTLKEGYVRNVPLLQVPLIQSTSLATGREPFNTCYSQVPRVPTWGNITRLLAGLGRKYLPFLPVQLM